MVAPSSSSAGACFYIYKLIGNDKNTKTSYKAFFFILKTKSEPIFSNEVPKHILTPQRTISFMKFIALTIQQLTDGQKIIKLIISG